MVAELRKVIWPTRNQMVTYTIVVIIFVSFMVALVAGLDVLFARACWRSSGDPGIRRGAAPAAATRVDGTDRCAAQTERT